SPLLPESVRGINGRAVLLRRGSPAPFARTGEGCANGTRRAGGRPVDIGTFHLRETVASWRISESAEPREAGVPCAPRRPDPGCPPPPSPCCPPSLLACWLPLCPLRRIRGSFVSEPWC